LAGCALFLTALAARLPWLWQFPRYIDELKEVDLAYSIYWGQAVPLHNVAHDIGSMHNYILAVIFKLFGASIYWPRLYVALTSALTVVLIYRLGCKLFDKWTGLLAAGFLLTNGMHIMVTHMAWANCTTPFFFTLAMLAMVNTEKKKSGGWLIAAAFLWAAALQTHSSVIIYVIVALVYVFSRSFRKTTQLKASSYLAAAIVFIISYANMIYYNIASKGGSLKWLTRKQYALEHDPGIQAFFINLQNMIVEMIRTVSSTYQSESHALSYLLHPAFLAVLILVIIGAVLMLKKGDRLLVWMIIGGLAIIPWINHRYSFYLATRYVMPLILCLILLMSYSIVKLVKNFSLHSLRPKWVQYASGGVMAMLVVLQIIPFYNYCSQNQSTNLSNKMTLQVISIVQKEKGSHMILMDANIDIENRPIPYLLRISNEKFITISSNGKDQAKGSVAAWTKAIRNAGVKHLYAILAQSSYMAIKNDLEGAKIYELKSKIVIPSPKTELRKIYVVELNNSHLPKKTAQRQPNPLRIKADYILREKL
jgi:4-amino-4-deoxy-L-arabinose transferase-like glycosyltransferase